MSRVHIIGGGIAGLSAAVELAPQAEVFLYEAASIAGGRARSFYDSALGCKIDNGNHLVLSANKYLLRYVDLIGSRSRLRIAQRPLFPFFNLKTQKLWKLSLSSGKVPFWMFFNSRRPPNMGLAELWSFYSFLKADENTTAIECLKSGGLTEFLLKPLIISALNTSVESGSAKLFANIIRESLLQGGRGCHPIYPLESLENAFVNPALSYLDKFKVHMNFNMRIREIIFEKGRAVALKTNHDLLHLSQDDFVILATPSSIAKGLLPNLNAPDEYESILNIHFHLPFMPSLRGIIQKTGFLGVNLGISEWIFVKDRVISVTISAANRYASISKERLVSRVWQEVVLALRKNLLENISQLKMPEYRLINEKRATFAATSSQNAKRPGTATQFLNLVLAGDWISTGLPSTLEGAVRSGLAAVGELGFRSAISQGYLPINN
ncbi:hypothetical protein FAI40_09870 [Acetobacteraceae bacterium]|nr:hypothetical protein FAI40_09870 [Acetobacteraceae bacterium]